MSITNLWHLPMAVKHWNGYFLGYPLPRRVLPFYDSPCPLLTPGRNSTSPQTFSLYNTPLCHFKSHLNVVHQLSQMSGPEQMCWEKFANEPPLCTQRTQEVTCQKNTLCGMRILCTYIIWYQLTHSYACWRLLWHIHTNVRIFVTPLYEYQNTLWCESIHL